MKPTYSPFVVQPTIPRGGLVNLVGGAMWGKLTASPDLLNGTRHTSQHHWWEAPSE